MHVTIFLEGEPIIILSEGAAELLSNTLVALSQSQGLAGKKPLMDFLYALSEYTTLVPGQGYPLDIAHFFKSSQMN